MRACCEWFCVVFAALATVFCNIFLTFTCALGNECQKVSSVRNLWRLLTKIFNFTICPLVLCFCSGKKRFLQYFPFAFALGNEYRGIFFVQKMSLDATWYIHVSAFLFPWLSARLLCQIPKTSLHITVTHTHGPCTTSSGLLDRQWCHRKQCSLLI